MNVRTLCSGAAVVIALAAIPLACEAAGSTVRARFAYDGIANCQQPAIRNFPIHAEGSATLSTDRRPPST